MKKKKSKEPKRNSWDPLPWPTKGDKTAEAIYTAVGKAISNWEKFDGALGALFEALVSDQHGPAERAYAAVRTFEARLDMVRAASESYFDQRPDVELQERLKNIVRLGANFANRRNEITHAMVDLFRLKGEQEPIIERRGYGLFPPDASFKRRDLANTPDYCYTSPEIEYFATCFDHLVAPVAELCGLLYRARLRWQVEKATPHKKPSR